MKTLEKLQKIFRNEFDDKKLIITRETTADDIEDWDSLAQINLVAQIEKTFNCSFNITEIVELKNVGDMVDLVEKKANA